jgi:translation elongation factor EF-Ts
MAGLVTLEAEDSSAPLDALKRVGSSIAMHIVAQKPLFLSKDLVSAAALENERDVLRTQVPYSDIAYKDLPLYANISLSSCMFIHHDIRNGHALLC